MLLSCFRILNLIRPVAKPDEIPTHIIRECAKETVSSLSVLLYLNQSTASILNGSMHFQHPSFKRVTAHCLPVSLTSVCGKLSSTSFTQR